MIDYLNLPPFDPKISEQTGVKTIWDPIRKNWTALTPEEVVRQAFVSYLIGHKGYPMSHIANEQTITLNGMKRRCDSVIYDKSGSPKVIIEYKAPSVQLTNKVFDQIARYNIVLHVDYLIVSNGLNHYCVCMDYSRGSYSFMNEIPMYDEL